MTGKKKMKNFFTLIAAAGSCLSLLNSGCTAVDRPEPSGSPYDSPVKPAKEVFSPEEAVNAAVSAVSLRMAVSPQGPFRVIPVAQKTSVLGFKVMDSLSRMRLSRISASATLLLEDSRNDRNEWSVIFRHPDGRIFLSRTFQLKGGGHAGK